MKESINTLYPALFYFASNLIKDEKVASKVLENLLLENWKEGLSHAGPEIKTLYQKLTDSYIKFHCSKSTDDDLVELRSEIEYWVCRTEILRHCYNSLLILPKRARKFHYLEFLEKMKNENSQEFKGMNYGRDSTI